MSAKEIDGFSDLYLPARREMRLAWINVPELFEDGYYWTSTQSSPDSAWCQDFGDGGQGDYDEVSQLRARAVRRLFLVPRRIQSVTIFLIGFVAGLAVMAAIIGSLAWLGFRDIGKLEDRDMPGKRRAPEHAQPHAAMPAGWKLVPVEPDLNMWKVAVTNDVWPLTPQSFRKMWIAILDVAPSRQEGYGNE